MILCTVTNFTSDILLDCEALSVALPHRYHLKDHLQNFEGNAVERDFVASAALNLLHVRFLLHSVFMAKTFEPSEDLLKVSGSMLKLAAEVAVLQSSLANSGTGFIWKVSSCSAAKNITALTSTDRILWPTCCWHHMSRLGQPDSARTQCVLCRTDGPRSWSLRRTCRCRSPDSPGPTQLCTIVRCNSHHQKCAQSRQSWSAEYISTKRECARH